jgi:regulator of sirC expression with transglutaminase-like and TPR domain
MNEEIVRLGLMDDANIALDEAALELAALDNPGVELAPYRELLDAMTAELERQRSAARNVYDQAALLAGVIAGEHDFRGNTDNYDDPANADLIAVIDRRRGLPVTLSIIYVALARRLGWKATALNTPGHLLVLIGAPPASVVIDPFNAGAIVDSQALAKLFAQAATAPLVAAPLSNQATLVRLLFNQASRAQQSGHTERALTLYQRMTAVAPLTTQLWWERAELEQQLGHLAAARISLSAMLETTRDANLRSQIRQALDKLARSAH